MNDDKDLKKVLFALNTDNSNKIEESLLQWYQKEFNKKFVYSKEYYLQGVATALEEGNYDVLVINETLEANPISINFIDALTDKFTKLTIILVLDEHHKEDGMLSTLFALGVYNCLFKSDLSVQNLDKLIYKAREKREAKLYYRLDNNLDELSNVVMGTSQLTEIPEDEINIVLDNFDKATSENIEELFTLAEQTYSFQQMVTLISLLKNNEETIKLLKNSGCSISKYEKALNREVNKVVVKEKIKQVQKIIEKPVEKIVEVEKPIYIKQPGEKEIVEKEIIREVLPDDYKKVIAIVGAANDVGSTTLIEMLSYVFSKEKRVAILDFAKNHDLFEKYIFKEETDEQPLQSLVNGVVNPFKINKRCSLFSAIPNTMFETSEMIKAVDTAKNDNEIILLDLNLQDLAKVYAVVDKVVIVVTPELTNIKYFTEIFNNLVVGGNLPNKENKIQFVVNKIIDDDKKLKKEDLIDCYLCKINYLDNDDKTQIMDNINAIYNIKFNTKVILNSYNMISPIGALSEEEIKYVYRICKELYPINCNEQVKKNNGFGKKLFGIFKMI